MLSRIRSWLDSVLRRSKVEKEMASEMEFHLAVRRDDLIRRGLSPDEASRHARLEFGAVERYKEECRESLGLRLLDQLRGDLRYAWRQLGKTPTFTILAVAILAIGIGANTAIFSAIDAFLLRMLPVQQPEQLRRLEWAARKTGFFRSYDGDTKKNSAGERVAWSISYPVYKYLRDHTSTLSGLITFSSVQRINLTIRGHAELAGGQVVSGNYFSTLGSQTLLGRTLTPEDDQPGGISALAVLSYGFWQRMFGGDAQVLRQSFAVNGTPVVIVGVLPKNSCGISPYCPDVILPMAMEPVLYPGSDVLQKPDRWYLEAMGRLKPGVSEERARAEIELLMRQAILDYKPDREYDPPRVALIPGGQGLDRVRNTLEQPFRILAWAVGAVLVIACANIAGLLLARATARHREIGIRLAIGASRGRLVRQLLTESLLLSALGGAAGVLLAYLAGDSIARLFVTDPRPLAVEVALNFRVLAFSVAMCVATGLVFGLAPALRATRVDLVPMLKTSSATAERSRYRIGKALIAVQVALSLILAVGATVFVRTLINLNSEPIGFRPENLLVFQLNPTLNGYKEQRLLNFHEDVVRRLGQIPGVRSASMSRWGILSGGATRDGVTLPGQQKGVPVYIHYVSPRFFETIGFPLLAGRDIAWSDRETSQRVMVINETLAKQIFAGQNPVGRSVEMNGNDVEIVGLAGDTKFESLRRSVPATVYIPFRQNVQFSMTYVVRSETELQALVTAVRRVVESVDPNVPMYEVKTQVEQINDLIRRERLFAALLSGFAVLALVLACMGIYGTLAYLVTRRTPEIGLRQALGAKRADIVGLVLRESIAPVTVGVVIGVAGSLAAGKLVESILFGLKPQDPLALATASAILLGSAILAGWWPAHRASRIAPMAALRQE